MDISVDISSFVKNKSLQSDLRRIRSNRLSFELKNELPQFDNFYYNMYLPYITKRHGNQAFVMKYESMKEKFRNCDLLLIKKEKEYIAGILLAYEKDVARLWSIGVKDGNSDYIKYGAIGALFYFSIHHLKGKGYKRVSFGLSRAFLNDGVLQYKKKWNLQMVDTDRLGFLFSPLSKTAAMKGFLLNNPFIYIKKPKINGAVFMESNQPLTKKDLQKIRDDYYLVGMNKLVIYKFGKHDSEIQEVVPSALSERMTICSAECIFK